MNHLILRKQEGQLSRRELSDRIESRVLTLLLADRVAAAEHRDRAKAIKATAKTMRKETGNAAVRSMLKKFIHASESEVVARIEKMNSDYFEARAEIEKAVA